MKVDLVEVDLDCLIVEAGSRSITTCGDVASTAMTITRVEAHGSPGRFRFGRKGGWLLRAGQVKRCLVHIPSGEHYELRMMGPGRLMVYGVRTGL